VGEFYLARGDGGAGHCFSLLGDTRFGTAANDPDCDSAPFPSEIADVMLICTSALDLVYWRT
jgi:hypothetical protein